MSFRITGLPVAEFQPLFALSDDALDPHTARRILVTERNATPCRVTLDDAEPGERVLLLNYQHQPAATPFQASYAIYVREDATDAFAGT